MKPLIALVVDDSILVRNTIKEGIKSCGGVAVFQAANGQDAVEVYKQHRPDIVFLDIVMPLRGGLEALVD
ncbi:MAG: response regulator, partial [Bacillota bacterium]|nr:response regulator [Bacillota bacterium]